MHLSEPHFQVAAVLASVLFPGVRCCEKHEALSSLPKSSSSPSPSLPLGLWGVGWEGKTTDMAFQRPLRTGLLGCCTAVARIREKSKPHSLP